MSVKVKSRAALVNQITRYQIVLRNWSTVAGLVAPVEMHLGFTARRTKGALFDALRANGDAVIAATKMTDQETFEYHDSAWRLRDRSPDESWRVTYSGKTERDFCQA